jgi:hypothetical protein
MPLIVTIVFSKYPTAYTFFWKAIYTPAPNTILHHAHTSPPHSFSSLIQPFCLLQSVSQCFPHSRVWSGLLFSRKFIVIVSSMSAKPSLCNATPKRKCSSYNLDLKLDDDNRYKHRGDRATDLVRAVWIPEASNPNIYVVDIHVLKILELSGLKNTRRDIRQQVTFERHWVLGSNFCPKRGG